MIKEGVDHFIEDRDIERVDGEIVHPQVKWNNYLYSVHLKIMDILYPVQCYIYQKISGLSKIETKVPIKIGLPSISY